MRLREILDRGCFPKKTWKSGKARKKGRKPDWTIRTLPCGCLIQRWSCGTVRTLPHCEEGKRLCFASREFDDRAPDEAARRSYYAHFGMKP